MKAKLLVIVGIWWGIGVAGCQTNGGDGIGEENKPRVVSTSTIIADLVTQVGRDEIEHQGIMQPGSDPHVYEPTPRDGVALEKANLIVYNGYNLEPGIIRLIEGTSINADKFAVGELVKPLDFEYQGQKQPDPHVWGDAQNAIMMVKGIRDRLIKLSPEDEAEFTSNANQLIAELEDVDTWISKQIQTIPPSQRQLVTTHDAFQYYATAYGLEVAGTLIGISTEEQPSAQTVKNLAEEIKKTKVPAIFAETTINPKLITTVAEEARVKLAPQELYSDSIGASGSEGDSYLKMLIANTESIVESLGGNYEPYSSKF